jgi:uncharacterized protein
VRIDNTFDVSLPPEDTWALLQDLALIASCWPGAHLDGVVDGEYRGGLSAEIGPVNVRYTGTARFTERDEVDRRAVIQARGREERGRGAASATITAVLSPAGGATRVDVSTEMTMNGPAARCGRSLLAEVSAGLVRDFARCLEATITEDGGSSEPVDFRRARSEPEVNGDGEVGGAVRTEERGSLRPGDEGRRCSEGGMGRRAGAPGGAANSTVGARRTVAWPPLRRAVTPAAAAIGGFLLGRALGRRSARRV